MRTEWRDAELAGPFVCETAQEKGDKDASKVFSSLEEAQTSAPLRIVRENELTNLSWSETEREIFRFF